MHTHMHIAYTVYTYIVHCTVHIHVWVCEEYLHVVSIALLSVLNSVHQFKRYQMSLVLNVSEKDHLNRHDAAPLCMYYLHLETDRHACYTIQQRLKIRSPVPRCSAITCVCICSVCCE